MHSDSTQLGVGDGFGIGEAVDVGVSVDMAEGVRVGVGVSEGIGLGNGEGVGSEVAVGVDVCKGVAVAAESMGDEVAFCTAGVEADSPVQPSSTSKMVAPNKRLKRTAKKRGRFSFRPSL